MNIAVQDTERENARLLALDALDVLDTPREEAFDRITRLARKLFDVPTALLSFMDAHRQWHKAREGMDGEEAPREHTFCRHVIENGKPLVVADATKDPRFSQNPGVLTDPGVRFYAGLPLKTRDGHNIGTFCLVDTEPRGFGAEELAILSDLAQIAMDELELRQNASRDSLTGAWSRKAFKEEAARAVALALRHHDDLSVVSFDLDGFKAINDRLGHAAGDAVLAGAVQAITEEMRDTDLIGRLGGEEFAVLLPNTGAAGALISAEKLRRALERSPIAFEGQEIRVTASFGVASLDAATRDINALLAHADKALYEAKAAGRNRVLAWRAPEAELHKHRRRVLKAGQILFNARTSSIDCTVRGLSDDGATLAVSSTMGIPKRFDLAIRSDGFERPCRIVSQTDRLIEVEFEA